MRNDLVCYIYIYRCQYKFYGDLTMGFNNNHLRRRRVQPDLVPCFPRIPAKLYIFL